MNTIPEYYGTYSAKELCAILPSIAAEKTHDFLFFKVCVGYFITKKGLRNERHSRTFWNLVYKVFQIFFSIASYRTYRYTKYQASTSVLYELTTTRARVEPKSNILVGKKVFFGGRNDYTEPEKKSWNIKKTGLIFFFLLPLLLNRKRIVSQAVASNSYLKKCCKGKTRKRRRRKRRSRNSDEL